MTDSRTESEALSPVKRALLEIRDLKAQLARTRGRLNGPIAITGMGLRFPGGVHDADSFARLIWSATDAISGIPPERWSLESFYSDDPDEPGKMTTRFGGFIDQVDCFDAEFFGISPREAASMDPQQRVMLEVAWAALEDAGRAPGRLGGSRTGVYLGVSNNDYGRALFAHRDSIDAYFSTGNAYSVLAGRLSYLLGLQGPSIAVDTACSSSLVALHLACQGLRLGECDMALAGAVNLILTPEMNINFSRARMMAPDGRCKTFDAAADGYVRGEGCGVLVLRRLDDALADGDRILGVIRGSALNQDGRSGGLTAPNGPAQEAVIRAALENASVAPSDIGYVEAHGTGTPLGDPLEVGALGAVLCQDRERPLTIGSVKTNIGHLEAAAGMAGVMKVLLGLQRHEIPPQLHFNTGNPHIDWAGLAIEVATRVEPWAPINGRRLAGVSSFGFSGTNAHVIIEEAPLPQPKATVAQRPRHLLALSARDEPSLAELVRRYEARLATEDESADLADLCYTANAGRSHFACRIAVAGASAGDLRSGLHAFGAGGNHAGLAVGRCDPSSRPRVAFLFTGQGAQHAGMGRLLYESSPLYRRTLDYCATRLDPLLERGLLDVMFAPADATPIDDTTYAQPLMFAHEYALAQLWRSWGIEPVAVLGHSLGEYAAACIAGVLSLDDALALVAERGRLNGKLPPGGAMAAVFASEERVRGELEGGDGSVTIAAVNGPEHVVLSGERATLEATLGRLEGAGVRVRPLRVSFAAHSPFVEPVLAEFGKALAAADYQAPAIALVSNVTGAVANRDVVGHPDYWLAHLRQPVKFYESMQTLADMGITHCIEIGPHPVLLGMGAECIPGSQVEWLPSLRRDREDWLDLLESLQRLYVDGAEVDWQAFDRDYQRRRVALPTYPFRRRRHWMDLVGQTVAPRVSAAGRWTQMSTALQFQSERGPLELNVMSYPEKWDCLARLTSAHAIRTLREAGLFATVGERHGIDEVLTTAGIGSTYRHLVQRWLERLASEGLLRAEAEAFVATAPLPEPDLPALWAEAHRRFADNQPLLAYVRHCGGLVGKVLTGVESPLETLFPGGSFELAQGLYERSTTMRYVNGLAAAALEALANARPEGRKLRVLEVGAGTGGTTAALLPLLPADGVRYHFTDVSDVFLDQAQMRFEDYPFVEYGRFDVDLDPAEQGYPAGAFDVIVSANAVHASKNLRVALERLHALLAPGGVLMLVESTTHMAWFDMTTGLIEGWQHFEDDLRQDNPLLAPDAWIGALLDSGFDEAQAWPAAGSSAEALGQHVLVARVAGEPGLQTGSSDSVTAATPGPARTGATAEKEQADAFRQRVLETLPADRLESLRDFVRDRVVRVLRLDAAEPPGRNHRLMDLGFDSLMAVQLRNALGSGLGLGQPLPATLMFDYPTIDALAAHLLERLDPPAGARGEPPETGADRTPEVLGTARVAAMSDDEIEALLIERLDKR